MFSIVHVRWRGVRYEVFSPNLEDWSGWPLNREIDNIVNTSYLTGGWIQRSYSREKTSLSSNPSPTLSNIFTSNLILSEEEGVRYEVFSPNLEDWSAWPLKREKYCQYLIPHRWLNSKNIFQRENLCPIQIHLQHFQIFLIPTWFSLKRKLWGMRYSLRIWQDWSDWPLNRENYCQYVIPHTILKSKICFKTRTFQTCWNKKSNPIIYIVLLCAC